MPWHQQTGRYCVVRWTQNEMDVTVTAQNADNTVTMSPMEDNGHSDGQEILRL
jgi:hypothetical protein